MKFKNVMYVLDVSLGFLICWLYKICFTCRQFKGFFVYRYIIYTPYVYTYDRSTISVLYMFRILCIINEITIFEMPFFLNYLYCKTQ